MNSESMTEIGLEMSNFDGEIDEGMADALMGQEGDVFGYHCGWNFCARVFYRDNAFHSEVQRYGVHVETITAASLEDLMKSVNEQYGYE